MSQLTCIACQLPIYRGQRAINLEFGRVEQSAKSQRDILKGYAVDLIHFECIQTYLGRIDGELYDAIIEHHKREIRKNVVADLREEIRQEIYDEVIDDIGRTCAVCREELEESAAEDEEDKLIQSAIVRGLHPPTATPLPPSPFSQFPILPGQIK